MTGDETRRQPGAALDRLRRYVSTALDDELADRQAVLERAGTELGIICAGLPADAVVLTAVEDARLREAIGEAVTVMHVHARACMFRAGSVVLSSAEADTAWQALADAAAWRAWRGEGHGCGACGYAGKCPEHARDDVVVADYAALRVRLGGDRR
jgi:hypothetical protein